MGKIRECDLISIIYLLTYFILLLYFIFILSPNFKCQLWSPNLRRMSGLDHDTPDDVTLLLRHVDKFK